MVAGTAGNIPIAGQNRIVEQKPADPCLVVVKYMKIRGTERFGRSRAALAADGLQNRSECEQNQAKEKGHPMRIVLLTFFLLVADPAHAEIEQARDLMEAGKYEAAMGELLPAARSGNADAEKLIGVMYALGLGVERDDRRAFDWYLRAAMKGHPGAQTGVAWYYETGRGVAAPDLVRAYTWYALSAIGGDPDGAISQEEVRKKMTPEQIEIAHLLINDYKTWLYPFR